MMKNFKEGIKKSRNKTVFYPLFWLIALDGEKPRINSTSGLKYIQNEISKLVAIEILQRYWSKIL